MRAARERPNVRLTAIRTIEALNRTADTGWGSIRPTQHTDSSTGGVQQPASRWVVLKIIADATQPPVHVCVPSGDARGPLRSKGDGTSVPSPFANHRYPVVPAGNAVRLWRFKACVRAGICTVTAKSSRTGSRHRPAPGMHQRSIPGPSTHTRRIFPSPERSCLCNRSGTPRRCRGT